VDITGTVTADGLTVETASGGATAEIVSGGGTSSLFMGDPSDRDSGSITYANASDSMQFVTNASERMRITSGGLVGIGESSPSFDVGNTGIHIGGASSPAIRLKSTTTGSGDWEIYADSASTGGLGFYEHQNNATYMYLSEGGLLGIGNSIPDSFNAGANNLVVGSGSGSEGITIYGGAESNLFFADGTASADNLRGRIEYSHISEVMKFYVNNLEAMRIDSSQRVGIGTSSPSQKLSIVESGGSARMELLSGTSGTSIIDMGDTSDADIGGIRYSNSNDLLSFRAANDERMSLDSGSLGVGVNAASASGRIHSQESNNRHAAFIHNTNASFSSATLQVSTSRNTTNSTYSHLMCAIHGVAVKMAVRDSGDLVNSNNSYGSLSDQRMKENIVDADSQWDDIKAVQVRKYNRIGATQKELGVIAQELEASNMGGLVDESEWFDVAANPDNEVRKSVKYSVLYMKAVKALQEAMTRIETLEAKVAALEAAE
jgi:hypothetical protein